MRKKFFGIYYKHQNKDGYTIAVIESTSSDGDMIQIITNDKSYIINDINSVKTSFNGITFNVNQDDLTLHGYISYGPLLKPRKDIMSYYRFLPIECKHKIYSMHHDINGHIIINGQFISFDSGDGYIEGDRGRNFPEKYLWLNASNNEASIMLAVASIPLGIITITGVTCMIEYQNKEYRFGTYNFAKAKKISKTHIVIKKGKYVLDINVDDHKGHKLKAPIKGEMVRYIHECPSVGIRYTLSYKDKVVMDIKHPCASFEYVYQ